MIKILLGGLAREIKDSEIVIVQGKMTKMEVQPIILEDIRKVLEEDQFSLGLENLTKKPRKTNLRSHQMV